MNRKMAYVEDSGWTLMLNSPYRFFVHGEYEIDFLKCGVLKKVGKNDGKSLNICIMFFYILFYM